MQLECAWGKGVLVGTQYIYMGSELGTYVLGPLVPAPDFIGDLSLDLFGCGGGLGVRVVGLEACVLERGECVDVRREREDVVGGDGEEWVVHAGCGEAGGHFCGRFCIGG